MNIALGFFLTFSLAAQTEGLGSTDTTSQRSDASPEQPRTVAPASTEDAAHERRIYELLPRVADNDVEAAHLLVNTFCDMSNARKKVLVEWLNRELSTQHNSAADWAMTVSAQCIGSSTIDDTSRAVPSTQRAMPAMRRGSDWDVADGAIEQEAMQAGANNRLDLQKPLRVDATREATEHMVYGAIFANAAVLSGIGTVFTIAQLAPTALAAMALDPQTGVVYVVISGVATLLGVGATAIFYVLSARQFEAMEESINAM